MNVPLGGRGDATAAVNTARHSLVSSLCPSLSWSALLLHCRLSLAVAHCWSAQHSTLVYSRLVFMLIGLDRAARRDDCRLQTPGPGPAPVVPLQLQEPQHPLLLRHKESRTYNSPPSPLWIVWSYVITRILLSRFRNETDLIFLFIFVTYILWRHFWQRKHNKRTFEMKSDKDCTRL